MPPQSLEKTAQNPAAEAAMDRRYPDSLEPFARQSTPYDAGAQHMEYRVEIEPVIIASLSSPSRPTLVTPALDPPALRDEGFHRTPEVVADTLPVEILHTPSSIPFRQPPGGPAAAARGFSYS